MKRKSVMLCAAGVIAAIGSICAVKVLADSVAARPSVVVTPVQVIVLPSADAPAGVVPPSRSPLRPTPRGPMTPTPLGPQTPPGA